MAVCQFAAAFPRRHRPLADLAGEAAGETHAAHYCDLRAVISTATKQGRGLLTSLVDLLRSPQDLGNDLARG